MFSLVALSTNSSLGTDSSPARVEKKKRGPSPIMDRAGRAVYFRDCVAPWPTLFSDLQSCFFLCKGTDRSIEWLLTRGVTYDGSKVLHFSFQKYICSVRRLRNHCRASRTVPWGGFRFPRHCYRVKTRLEALNAPLWLTPVLYVSAPFSLPVLVGHLSSAMRTRCPPSAPTWSPAETMTVEMTRCT